MCSLYENITEVICRVCYSLLPGPVTLAREPKARNLEGHGLEA